MPLRGNTYAARLLLRELLNDLLEDTSLEQLASWQTPGLYIEKLIPFTPMPLGLRECRSGLRNSRYQAVPKCLSDSQYVGSLFRPRTIQGWATVQNISRPLPNILPA
jgi:hypothetical protein